MGKRSHLFDALNVALSSSSTSRHRANIVIGELYARTNLRRPGQPLVDRTLNSGPAGHPLSHARNALAHAV